MCQEMCPTPAGNAWYLYTMIALRIGEESQTHFVATVIVYVYLVSYALC